MLQAWTYPGEPSCNAPLEYRNANIDVIKAEFLTVTTRGTIKTVTAGCNAYSAATLADIKAHSLQQYVTISANAATTAKLCATAKSRKAGVDAILVFLRTNRMTGAEPDFEQIWKWTPTVYANYKKFITELSSRLQANGFKVMIDVPAFTAPHRLFKYEDFGMVDFICPMAYDRQWDIPNGSVTDITWLEDVCEFAKTKIDPSKIVMGLPTYGYHATKFDPNDPAKNAMDIVVDTKKQSSMIPGFNNAVRNADGEKRFEYAGKVYFYQDTMGINMKIATVQAHGIQHVSLWHLGGNDLPTINAI